jgi:hypothetical protein
MARPLSEELITLLRDADARQAACKGHAFQAVATFGPLAAEICLCGATRVWNTSTGAEATKEDVEAEQWREEMRRSFSFILNLNDKSPNAR